jgi:cysteine desulfurase
MTYLDHAATTPMLEGAWQAMTEELRRTGNASSLHAAGRRARRVVEESRERVAAAFGARPSEVVFTSGGTEADNLALKGLYWARVAEDPRRRRIITTAVEHHAVLDPVAWLASHESAEVEHLPVDPSGRVEPAALRERLAEAPDDVALVSVMWANSEVGSVQPVAACAAVAADVGVPFHSDAVQAAPWLDVDFTGTAADALTISGHKLGGPHGVGALLLRRTCTPVPLLHGGGQERDVRSGTLDSPAVVAFAAAVEQTVAERVERATRVADLRDDLVRGVLAAVPDAVLNGPPLDDRDARLPGHAHLSFPGCEGDSLLLLLDARGIACSTGSACSAGVAQPSHVLLAMGAGPDRVRSSLRLTLGHDSTAADVDALCRAIGPVVARARAAAGAA